MIKKNKSRNNQTKLSQFKYIVFSIIVCVAITLTTVIACIHANKVATDSCIDILKNANLQLTDIVAFEDAIAINRMSIIIAFIQLLLIFIFIIYAFRKINYIRREAKKDLALSQDINLIRRRLLTAYKEPNLFREALERVAEIVSADSDGRCKLIALDNGIITDIYAWPKSAEMNDKNLCGMYMPEDFSDIYVTLKRGNIIRYNHNDIMDLYKGNLHDVVDRELVDNIVILPICGSDSELFGFIYVTNSRDLNYTEEILERIANALSTSLHNYKSYLALQNMGEFDGLTGLKSRNVFNRDTELLKTRLKTGGDNFFCIYIDANGLHEINNNFGHSYGDAMLRAIGKKITEAFDNDYSYRVGGDEFIVFARNTNINDIIEKTNRIKEDLSKDDYYISVGIAAGNEADSIDELNTISETRMYEDKKKYYSLKKNDRRKQDIDDKLAKIINDKEDQDIFLQVIKSHYLGVYLINLDNDLTRSIFKPPYFERILKDNNYNFRKSMKEYAEKFMVREYLAEFENLLNYGYIRTRMKFGKEIKFTYHKTDGVCVQLKIIPASDYSETKKDTIWIFEKQN